MKVAVVKKISTPIINRFVRDNIDIVIYQQISEDVDYKMLAEKFRLVSAFNSLEEGSWFNFQLVTTQLSALRKSYEKLFEYKGIDLEKALKKDLFWSFFKEYALVFQAEKFKKPGYNVVFYSQRNYFVKKMSLLKNLFFDSISYYKTDVGLFSRERENKIAFRVNSKSTPSIYGNLLEVLGRESVISFQSKHVELDQHLNSIFSKNISASTAKQKIDIPFFLNLKLLFSSFETEFLITFLINYKKLCNHVNEYDKLFESGIRKMVLNAGENEGEGNIASALAKKHNAKIFNYMNGAKAYSPQNVDTSFDYWFMPDKKTQELILSYCTVSEKQIPVTGHLLQEVAQKHIYSGTLDKYLKGVEDKKIIAMFTDSIFTSEVKSVFNFLLDYLNSRPDIIVLIRKHPAEIEPHNINHSRIIEMEKYPMESSQISLFDLLLKSDVAVSFSSTVSWQASWFGIPSLNYELTEKSRLPFVDDEKVLHVNTNEKLEHYLNKYLYSGKAIDRNNEVLDTANKIGSIILGA